LETLENHGKPFGKELPHIFRRDFVFLNRQLTATMYHQLLIRAFEKAKQEIRNQADTPAAEHLSEFILEDSGQPYGERSLRTRYKEAREGNPFDLRNYVVESLAHYLGYENFEAFLKEHPQEKGALRKISFYRKYSKGYIGLAVMGVFLVLVVLVMQYINQTRWMVWNEDHYIEARFDEQLLQEGVLKLYKEDRIQNFRKIEPDCNTTYRNPDGTARIWYGRNSGGELEYFTSHGLHPETAKTLRELSKYMFDKYVCPKVTD